MVPWQTTALCKLQNRMLVLNQKSIKQWNTGVSLLSDVEYRHLFCSFILLYNGNLCEKQNNQTRQEY